MSTPFIREPDEIEIGDLVRIHPQHLMVWQLHTAGEIGIIINKNESTNKGFWYYTVWIEKHGKDLFGWSSLEPLNGSKKI